MSKNLIPCLVALFITHLSAIAQPGTTDTRGIHYYINIAESIREGRTIPSSVWDSLFATPYFDLAINKVRFTTKEDVQRQMIAVYAPASSLTPVQEQKFKHHLNYKKHLRELKTYITHIDSTQIHETITTYLYPFLPERLQNKAGIPVIVITYFHSEEANGLEHMILQDALLSWKMDTYRNGLLSAHEAFHSVVTKALRSRLSIDLDQQSLPALMIKMLSGITQEGMADLIDKDVFSAPGSPMHEMISAFTENETSISSSYIRALDSTILSLSKNSKLKDPTSLSRKIMGYAGHQPGRYMARIIRDAGLISEVIADVENPFTFIYTYNKAVQHLNSASPLMSETAIRWLQQLEVNSIKPVSN